VAEIILEPCILVLNLKEIPLSAVLKEKRANVIIRAKPN
jgi:hypothetical protein